MQELTSKIKIGLLVALYTVECFLLATTLIDYALTPNYFAPPLEIVYKVVGIMFSLAYTVSLTIGAWGKLFQYLAIPIPVTLAVLYMHITLNQTQAKYIAVFAFFLMLYYTMRTSNLRDLFLKFEPKMLLTGLVRGVFFVFALSTAALIIINPTGERVNIGEKVGEIATEQIENVIEHEQDGLAPLLSFGLKEFNVKDQIATSINATIAPYRQFLMPLVAIAVFSIIQWLGMIVYFVVSVTLKPLFVIAQKLGFIRFEYVNKLQEVPTL